MNLRDRRAAMMVKKGDTIDIPLNVNLITSENTQSGYWRAGGSLNRIYTTYAYPSTVYKRTLPLPYDSRCTFSASNLIYAGYTTGLALDENLICRGFIEASTGTSIKNRCVAIEQETGYTIKYVCFSFEAAKSPTWIRTA